MKMQTKVFEIQEMKAEVIEGKNYITGFANTKDRRDSHGHIPTSFNGEPVYDVRRMKDNPVCFVDHWPSASNIAGNFIELIETEKGLWFKLLLRDVDRIHNPEVKDAVQAFVDGFGRALSIGGYWKFEDEDNPDHLTKAIIHEISIVGVGSDGNALTDVARPKSSRGVEIKSVSRTELKDLDASELEGFLKEGVRLSAKCAKAVVSAIKSAGLCDVGSEGHRDGVEGEELKAVSEELSKITNLFIKET